MKMILIKIGILNVFRNKRRSFLTSLAIGVGLMSLILADGLMLGMKNYMVNSVTEDFLGHGQIHNKAFRNTNKTKFILENLEDLKTEIGSSTELKTASFRAISPALIASAEGSNQIGLFGIEPEVEKKVSRLAKFIIAGTYLDNDPRSILIGHKLAKKLNVEVGGKIVITLSTLKGDSISQELLKVAGIFAFGSRDFDNQMAFINLKKMQTILQCSNCVHEVAIKFKNLNELETHFPNYKKRFSKGENVFESWRDLVPALDSAFKLNDISIFFLVILLGILVGAGIINTLYMSLFERKFEFGVLLAIGTRKKLLFQIVMIESLALAIGSIILGSILTLIFGTFLAVKGIDYGGISFVGVALREPIYFVFNPKAFFFFSSGLIVFTMMISVYPVYRLLQIKPSEALKLN